MKNNRGITLIALVITIIVLLILAGVSIAMLTGENGILTQSTRAKEDTSDAEIADRINMALNGEFANLLADGHFSGYTAPSADEAVALGTDTAIKSANGLDNTGVTYNVTDIGQTDTTGAEETGTVVLKIAATGSDGTEISGTITMMEDGTYKLTKANYPD